MKKNKLLIALGGVVIAVVAIVGIVLSKGLFAKAEYSGDYERTFGEFSAKTANSFLEDKKENTCYSPLSLFAALTLASEITEDGTRQEILEALGVDSLDELEGAYSKMRDDVVIVPPVKEDENEANNEDEGKGPIKVPEKDPSIITLCNSFWTTSTDVSDKCKNVFDNMQDKLGCDIFLRDGQVPDEINSWVSEKTNGLINEITSEDDPYTFMLVNTLYYKSQWAVDMAEIGKKEAFYLEDGKEVKTTYLEAEEETLEYVEKGDYTYVEVPLQDGEAILVLPEEGKKLDKLLSENKLNEILSLATSDEKKRGTVNLKVPEFEIAYDIGPDEFKETLIEDGVKQLFENPDWIDGLSGADTSITQKTKVILNEDGIEAAAATSISGIYSIEPDIKIDLEITYDRPFLYVLMQEGVPLFIGTVYNPAE